MIFPHAKARGIKDLSNGGYERLNEKAKGI